MGNYILCSHKEAKIPFYIESLQLNLFSLEELCYFIANYTPLADETVIGTDLTNWIEEECAMPGTAELVRGFLRGENGVYEAEKMILRSGHYFTSKQLERVFEQIEDFKNRKESEQRKMRADLLMNRNKYRSAIEEYRKILDMTGITSEEKEFRGKVYYNLGSAYARMFRLSTARRCYAKAFDLYKDDKIKKACLAAAYLEGGRQALEEEAGHVGADGGEVNTILLEIRSVDAPNIEENLSDLTDQWIRQYHENTGL